MANCPGCINFDHYLAVCSKKQEHRYPECDYHPDNRRRPRRRPGRNT
jgi:hypothetical protein